MYDEPEVIDSTFPSTLSAPSSDVPTTANTAQQGSTNINTTNQDNASKSFVDKKSPSKVIEKSWKMKKSKFNSKSFDQPNTTLPVVKAIVTAENDINGNIGSKHIINAPASYNRSTLLALKNLAERAANMIALETPSPNTTKEKSNVFRQRLSRTVVITLRTW